MNFSINYLEITADENTLNNNKEIYKNLSATKYVFNDFCENNSAKSFFRDFFGKNINIQAIVGKNGSGKSSLMDVLYMMVNNLAFFLTKNLNLPAASKIYYIPNLYAKICFLIDSKKYILNCDGNKMDLQLENNKPFEFDLEDENSFYDEGKIKKIAKYFFYTVVSNYSMQSFISSNYNQKVLEKEKDSWINSIFHKNDGYICPIVLNPFRGDGTIDLNREMELSKDRLASLLIWFNLNENYNGNSPFAPYLYSHIEIEERENFIAEKFENYFENISNEKKFAHLQKSDNNCILNFIEEELKNDDSFLREILSTYSVNYNKFNKFKKEACAYLLVKLMSIPRKYSSYSEFVDVYKIKIENSKLRLNSNKNKEKSIKVFLEKIKNDNSHITKKIRRTIHFLQIPFDKNSIQEINNYYNEHYKHKENFSSPSKIDEHLPPSIFLYELFLKKQIEKENKKETVPYSALSSGEIQMLQTLSIHAYHIENLISVPDDDNRPKYRNINLVFDEVEICFHPEYQRKFVKRLLMVLNTIIEAEKGGVSFNVFVITHSPFMLSDIPDSNILALNDGKRDSSFESKTLGANIYDLLSNQFFMESAIGAHVEKIVNEIIDDYNSFKNKKDRLKEKYENKDGENFYVKFSQEIGDEYLRDVIQDMILQMQGKNYKERKIESYKQKIEQLENKNEKN